MTPKKVLKRAGYTEKYNRNKLLKSIKAAFDRIGIPITDDELASIHRKIAFRLENEVVPTEQVNAAIVAVLGPEYPEVVQEYILYTYKKRKLRADKLQLLSPYYDEMTGEIKDREYLTGVEKSMSLNALTLAKRRYLWKKKIDGKEVFIETVDDLFKRVAVLGTLPHILYSYAKSENLPVEEISFVDSIVDEESIWEWLKDFKRLSSYFNLDKEKYRYVFNIPWNGEFFMTKWHVERLWVLAHRFRVGNYTGPELFKRMFLHLHKGEAEEFFHWLERTYEALVERRFVPNTPALVNAGRPLGQLSACFPLGYVPDDMEGIMNMAKDIALISKSGGGIGVNLSKLRPKGATVKSTLGVASGPISFLELYDKVLSVVSQGGVRRGAGMAIMEYWHPQVLEFIKAKEKNRGDNYLSTFNLSVGTDEKFWEAVYSDEEINFVEPHTGDVTSKIKARDILNKVAEYAWAKGDPAFIYAHNHNGYGNALREAKEWGKIKTTNPCGEIFLFPYGSCNLASIDIAKHIETDNKGNKFINWDKLQETIEITHNYLDNVNDVNKFPLDRIAEVTRRIRVVGLGIMGLAKTLYLLGLPYNSEEGMKTMSRIAEFVTWHTIYFSTEKAKDYGVFPEYDKSLYPQGFIPVVALKLDMIPEDEITLDWNMLVERIKKYGMRNFDLTTVPPTGSVSMLADTSSGVEPEFALVFRKDTTVGTYYYFNKVFEEEINKYLDEKEKRALAASVEKTGGLKYAEKPVSLPDEVWERWKKVFITAPEIAPDDHVVGEWMVARWITNAVSKTINLPHNAKVEDVRRVFVLAEKLGLKGITVYRDGSLDTQVLNTVNKDRIWVEPYPVSEYTKILINKMLFMYPYLQDFIEFIADTPKKEEKKEEKQSDKGIFLDVGIDIQAPVAHDNDTETKEQPGICPVCGARTIFKDGCETCPVCGWSKCHVG